MGCTCIWWSMWTRPLPSTSIASEPRGRVHMCGCSARRKPSGWLLGPRSSACARSTHRRKSPSTRSKCTSLAGRSPCGTSRISLGEGMAKGPEARAASTNRDVRWDLEGREAMPGASGNPQREAALPSPVCRLCTAADVFVPVPCTCTS
eukprot:7377501-Prymnesium_polylepis.1